MNEPEALDSSVSIALNQNSLWVHAIIYSTGENKPVCSGNLSVAMGNWTKQVLPVSD